MDHIIFFDKGHILFEGSYEEFGNSECSSTYKYFLSSNNDNSTTGVQLSFDDHTFTPIEDNKQETEDLQYAPKTQEDIEVEDIQDYSTNMEAGEVEGNREEDEFKKRGKIPLQTYYKYFKYSLGLFGIILIILFYSAASVTLYIFTF